MKNDTERNILSMTNPLLIEVLFSFGVVLIFIYVVCESVEGGLIPFIVRVLDRMEAFLRKWGERR